MEDLKACIRATESHELGCPFQEWYAHTAGGDKSPGKVRPGLYLVLVQGTPQNFFALPVSRCLLEVIQKEAKKAGCKEFPLPSCCGDLPDWVLRHD